MALSAPLNAVTSRASTAVRSVGQLALVYGIVALLGLVGIGFLIAALYIWLAAATDPLVAALLIGAGFIAVAGITLAVVVAQGQKRREQRRRAAANTALMASTMALANTGFRLASRARGPLFWPALAIVAAGLIFSRSGDDG